MRWSILITPWILLIQFPLMTSAATFSDGVVVAPSAVTVFEDRARVYRRLAVEMEIGSKEVILKGLPHGLDPSSVRARLLDLPGLVLGVRMEPEVHQDDFQKEVMDLTQQLELVEDQLQGVDARIEEVARLQLLTERLAAILAETVSKVGKGGILGHTSVDQIVEAQQWITDRQLTHSLEFDQLAIQRSEHRIKRTDIQEDLKPLMQGNTRTTWTAIVLIQAQEEGTGTVELAHDVPGARWVPVHEARLDEETSKVNWIARGQVIQMSGEDWNDVKLTLSTARSSLGLAPPALIPVRIAALVRREEPAATVTIETSEQADSYTGRAKASSAPAPRKTAKSLVGSEIVSGSGPIRFEVRAIASIPSDGSVHSVTISKQQMDAKLDYQSIPILSPHVFRRARLINGSGAPLLAGQVSCFRQDAYVGDGRVERVAAGQEFSRHFGSEGRILVRKVEVEDHSGSAGSFSKKLELKKAFKITVDSVFPTSVPFELVDRIPLSTLNGIDVELGTDTTPEPGLNEDGIVRWVVSLVPGETNEFILQWIATAKKDQAQLLERLK
ncbi:MAG: mucoidy inhibitor MuiA family protein [Planctomycetota bacterium]|nr:mucoidy inhibitor MuiA family protein [Planctomycetota bacterium]